MRGQDLLCALADELKGLEPELCAAYDAGSSASATTFSRSPAAVNRTGARAAPSSAPPPTVTVPAAARWASVSASASGPKSNTWLLASVTHATPISARRCAAKAGARKKNGLPGSSIGVPRSDTQHSRFSRNRSADRAISTSTGSSSGACGFSRSRSAMPRPSIVSPASASVSVIAHSYARGVPNATTAGSIEVRCPHRTTARSHAAALSPLRR